MSRMRFLLLAALAVSAAACDSEGTESRSGLVLYVGNQGNFSDNSGSLTRYDVEEGTVTQDAIPNLGGLVQNLYGGGNRLYVLLNFDDSFTTGRGRIDIIDAVSRQRTDQIDVRTPRALSVRTATSVGAQSFYVTNLYDDTVTLVDVVTGETGTPIAVGNNPEGTVDAYGRTYVANSGFGSGTTVSVLNTAAGTLTETLEDVCAGPRTLVRDGELEVWVICTGTTDFDTGAVTGGSVVVLDGQTGDVRTRFDYDEVLGSATFGRDGVFAPGLDRQEVYVIAGGAVLRFDARTNALDARIEVAGAPVGAVEYDPVAERLYLGRPDADNPFSEDGVVTIHDRTGTEVGRFGAGIAPSVFAFATETPIVEG